MMGTTSEPWFRIFWGGIWADNPASGRLIVLAILGLTAVAVAKAVHHLGRYRHERDSLAQVASRLQTELENRRQSPHDSHDAGQLSEHPTTDSSVLTAPGPGTPTAALVSVASLTEGIDRQTLIAERLAALAAFIQRRVRINPETLQKLSAARDEAQPGLPTAGFAASLAMLLGILGTFVGLSAMVQEIHLGLPASGGSVTLDSWTDSIEQLRGVLGGMKTAFSTSLVGMLCAILCSCLDFTLRRSQASYFERLERFTTEELLPATVPAVYHEHLLEQVTHQLEQSFGRLEEIYQQNRGALQELSAVESTFADIIDEVRTITRGEAARNLDRVIEQLVETNKAVLGVVDHLPRVVAHSERHSRDVLGRIENALSELPRLVVPGGPAPSPRLLWIAILGVGLVFVLSLFFRP